MNVLLDVTIGCLRRKADRGYSPHLIHTVRGVGFRLGRSMVTSAMRPAIGVPIGNRGTAGFAADNRRFQVPHIE